MVFDNDSITASTSLTSKEGIKSNKKSIVWKFMHEEIDKNRNSIIVCDKCLQKYSISTSTGVLAKHLNHKHNREECENSILDFFVGDQISFNTADNQWFHKMTSTLDP
ncbi:14236_t:CDS:2, partial [Gigaspora margarita]